MLSWVVESDSACTRSLYRLVTEGAAERCGCLDCQNFQTARPKNFPTPFAELLTSLSVDLHKEVGVSLVAPLEGKRSLYSGNYLFCGSIVAGRPHRGFPFLAERVDVFDQVHPEAHVALRPFSGSDLPWRDQPCVRVEFLVVLPWVLAGDRARPIDLDRASRDEPSS